MGKWYFLLVFVVFMAGCENTTEQLFRRGDWLYDQKKYNEAIAQYNEVIERNGKIQYAYYRRATCYVEQKKYTEALKDLEKVIFLITGGSTGPVRYIVVLNKNGPFADDVAQYQVDYYEAVYQRGLIKEKMRSAKSAIADFQSCIDNRYNINNCRIWQGMAWLDIGENDKACACFYKVSQPERDTANPYLAVDTSYQADAKRYISQFCQ